MLFLFLSSLVGLLSIFASITLLFIISIHAYFGVVFVFARVVHLLIGNLGDFKGVLKLVVVMWAIICYLIFNIVNHNIFDLILTSVGFNVF